MTISTQPDSGRTELEAEELSIPASSKNLNSSYSGIFILVLIGFLLMISPALFSEGKKNVVDKPAISSLDSQLIKGEITEEEYVQKLKAMK